MHLYEWVLSFPFFSVSVYTYSTLRKDSKTYVKKYFSDPSEERFVWYYTRRFQILIGVINISLAIQCGKQTM